MATKLAGAKLRVPMPAVCPPLRSLVPRGALRAGFATIVLLAFSAGGCRPQPVRREPTPTTVDAEAMPEPPDAGADRPVSKPDAEPPVDARKPPKGPDAAAADDAPEPAHDAAIGPDRSIDAEIDTRPVACRGAQPWQPGTYKAGAIVTNGFPLHRYQCKPYPYEGWCGMAEYEPGLQDDDMFWKEAWTDLGPCP